MELPENKSKKLFINMRGIPCLLFALILSTKSGSGTALESTPIHGRENIGDSLEEMMLALRTTTLEHAKTISQMKHDFENMKKATGKLSTDYENLRKEHENLNMTVLRRPSQLETYTMHGGWTVTANLITTGTGQTQDNTCASAGQQANYTLGGLACKGKTPAPDNPAQSCSSLRQAGSTHPGYYLINSKKGRLDVVLCRMDLEEFDPKFQVETNARIAGGGFLHGKVTHPDNPAQSCSSLRRAGSTHPGYYLINSKKGRLDVVMCRMDLEDNNPEFQKETNARIAREAIYFDVYGALGSNGSVVHYSGVDVNIGGAMNYSSDNVNVYFAKGVLPPLIPYGRYTHFIGYLLYPM
ncbi:unnamed protein product [Darwinula stevensoni]|uniref:Uncharacterized protein n=1 Tax=Darwinula stevensoni TaxID=69355 RepID=A0A7R9AEU1_9CRUS|nr:unnamed protein product [Darwinula stevensoni]CAG0901976.1 unnamed protein product [Darwinula stevensoni]